MAVCIFALIHMLYMAVIQCYIYTFLAQLLRLTPRTLLGTVRCISKCTGICYKLAKHTSDLLISSHILPNLIHLLYTANFPENFHNWCLLLVCITAARNCVFAHVFLPICWFVALVVAILPYFCDVGLFGHPRAYVLHTSDCFPNYNVTLHFWVVAHTFICIWWFHKHPYGI